MPHDHSHGGHHHHHGHGMNAADFGKAFAVGIVLNLGFVAVETVYGFAANSMALLADAEHDLADVLALATAWGGAILAKRPPTRAVQLRPSRRIDPRRAGQFGGPADRGVVHRLSCSDAADHPGLRRGRNGQRSSPESASSSMRATALMFARGRRSDINVRGAYLHMVADALVSAGVVGGRRADRGDRLALDRSGGEPRRRRADLPRRRRFAAQFGHHGACRSPPRHRSRTRSRRTCLGYPAWPRRTISTSGR